MKRWIAIAAAAGTLVLFRCTCFTPVSDLGDGGDASLPPRNDAGLDSGGTDAGAADGSPGDSGLISDAGSNCGYLRGPCCPGNQCDPTLSCMQTNGNPNPVCIGCYNCDGGCGASGQPCCIGNDAWVLCDVGLHCSGCGVGTGGTCVAPPDGGGVGAVCACPSDCAGGLLCCYPCGTPGCQNVCTFTDGGPCPLVP